MRRMPNVGNIIDEADYQRRMSLPPVRIEGEGEEISTPDTPVRIIGLGHDTLEQVDDGWKGEWGLDLRPDLANEAIFNPQPRPAVARRVQTMPGLDLRADLAELDAEDKAISQVSGAVGDVAGRAMAGRGQALAGGTPSTPRGMVADVMKGAARGPLVPQKGAGGGIPPEVASFVAKRAQQEGPDQSEMEAARGRRGLGNGLAMLSEQLTAAADMGSGMKSQPGLYRGMREAADREVTDQQAREDAVRRFVAEKMARDDKFAAAATKREQFDATQRRLTEQDRLAAEKRTADAARQAELDALNKRKVESEIAQNEAQAARTKAQARGAGRGGPGAPKVDGKGEDALAVPGYARAEGAPDIAPKEAQDFRNSTAAAEHMRGLINDMRAVKDDLGREFYDKEKIEGAGTSIVLGIKEMESTGALDKGTIEIVQPLIPTPMDSAETARNKLARLEATLESRMASRAKSLGYESTTPKSSGDIGRAGGAAVGRAMGLNSGPKPPPSPNHKRIRLNGRMGWWDGVSQLPAGAEVIDG